MRPPAVSSLGCAGCGAPAPPPEIDSFAFRCAQAARGDRRYHIIARTLDTSRVDWPSDRAVNPFVRYRRLLHSWHVARAQGLSDEWFVDLVEHVSAQVATVDDRRFAVTPCASSEALATALAWGSAGRIWVKDETGQVSGSHKARHLMGVMLYLRVVEQLGLASARARLAIASCGNAALAAAVVARAADRPLDVFVPPWAHPAVTGRLRTLGAVLHVCERQTGHSGDPCYRAFSGAVDQGAVPFCVQGPANGLTIDGGETLGFEIADAVRDHGGLDAIVVQVGGGALASACNQAMDEAHRLGAVMRRPRLYTVQTRGGYPLKRCYDHVVDAIARALGDAELASMNEADRAATLATPRHADLVTSVLRDAAAHPADFMWPWETEPRSIATGILDDETYDWLAVVDGMLRTGGFPLVVSEEELEGANDLARRTTGIDVDHTGSAGLAGLTQLRAMDPRLANEHVAVLFTGVRR